MDELTASTEVETPLESTESVMTVESLHAIVLELQGQVANLQEIADKATPVEPAAVEAEASEGETLEGDLLEETPEEPVSEKELEDLDSQLQRK